MNNKEFKRFCELRNRLWIALNKVDWENGCKSYEGAIEVVEEYPNFFEKDSDKHTPCFVGIKLHCYVLGPARHYDFFANSWSKVFKQFDQWLKANADNIEREDAPDEG